MPRLPKENIYVTRCHQCGSLIMLNGDELLQRWEAVPEKNHGYAFKCPGCGNRTSYTTTELLMKHNNDDVYKIPFEDYDYAMSRQLGHGIILEEGDRVHEY